VPASKRRTRLSERRLSWEWRKGDSEMKSIGKYQVIEELGTSATGRTYRVRDAFRNREFAAKILQTVPGLSAEAKEQFCAHLTACAELAHRHIAKIHDMGEVEDGIFVATEWRSGTDLRRFMEENQDLALDQKLAVIAQVAEGLAFAHSRGIAHGDLKPSNIFVDGARDVSILDFGIAKWLAALLDAGSRPEGLVAKYLAPEQVLGQAFDARSDIFALGLMLYEFASRKYPFSADPGLIPREIVHSEPTPLHTLDAQIPEELGHLVARALHKDPAQRLQTAEEFASGLYLAAQQLRRVALAHAPAGPPSNPPSVEPMFLDQLPPAMTSLPVTPKPTPAPVLEAAPPFVEQTPPPAPKVRERPQDAESAPQPWSARSYAAGGARPPSPSSLNHPKPPAAPAAAAWQPPEPPPFEAPKSFLKPPVPLPTIEPAAVPPRVSKTTKRMLTAVLGLIIAAGIIGSLVSRQNLRASQGKSHVVASPAGVPAPVEQPSITPTPAAPEARTPKREEPLPDDVVNPEVSAKQVLNGPVRTLWESGRYAQALALVNQVLADDATNEDARSWKKKIREAQAAEAALK
jgi:eukaryotic-like serine/threonine-protein kinase